MWSVTRPDGTVATGWFLLPLRLFLGVTFLFAGLQKLANPQFLNERQPDLDPRPADRGPHASPIHALISHLVPIASTVGVVIAVGEVAIGVGVLVGLLTRVAAVAGMALSFGLFLTVSFHSSPYFTGSDIVFFFAWTPLALAGAAGAPALDTWLATRRPDPAAGPDGAVPRRAVLSAGAVTGIVAAAVVVCRRRGRRPRTGGRWHLRRRSRGPAAVDAPARTVDHHVHPAGTATTGAAARPPPPPPRRAPPSARRPGCRSGARPPSPIRPAATRHWSSSRPPATSWPSTPSAPMPGARWPTSGRPSIIACPCHGSEFDANTGAVIRGPATRGLTPIKVTKGANGDLYVPDDAADAGRTVGRRPTGRRAIGGTFGYDGRVVVGRRQLRP